MKATLEKILLSRPVFAIALLLAGAAGIFTMQKGFHSIQEMRQLDRIPPVSVSGIVPGEVNITAWVESSGSLLNSPDTNTPSVYYRYLHEVEERDSDGDTHWRTVSSSERFMDFILSDKTGRIKVSVAESAQKPIDWSMPSTHVRHSGKHRYTEWRVEPGDKVFVFGMAKRYQDLYIDFETAGGYTPIISKYGAKEERADMGTAGIYLLWGGLFVFSFTAFFFMGVIRSHRVLVFLLALVFVLAGTLIQLSLSMMKQDLVSGHKRYQARVEASEEEMRHLLSGYEIESSGLELPPGNIITAMQEADRQKLFDIRTSAMRAWYRLERQTRAFPEVMLAPLWGVRMPEKPVQLTQAEEQMVLEKVEAWEPAKLGSTLAFIIMPVAFILMVVASYFGFRQIKFKRFIENLPTTTTDGVVFGLSELKGYIRRLGQDSSLTSPLTHSRCIYYSYKVEEKRRSGKNSRWVTIENEEECTEFFLEDDNGQLMVKPDDADIITRHKSTERRGSRRYTETLLKLNDPLFAIGHVDVNRKKQDELLLKKGDSDEPWILSNYSEMEVMFKKSRFGMFLLLLAFGLLLLGSLTGFGYAGSFAATDFLLAAMLAPVYMSFVMIVLHYNDLVYLRQRADRNLSNIGVSLRKRKNLIPRLETIVKKYMEHERELHEAIADMRTHYHQQYSDPAELARYMESEARFSKKMLALREDYPELMAHDLVKRFMGVLTRLENEVALMRSGYNDAVETYNTRIAVFPDVLLSKTFGFGPLKLIA